MKKKQPKEEKKKHHWFEPKKRDLPPADLPDQSAGPSTLDRENLQALFQRHAEEQVLKEQKELESAPKIPVAQFQPDPFLSVSRQQELSSHSFTQGAVGMIGRCSWCGRVQQSLVLVETQGGIERYKGVNCCGQRHDGQQIRSTHGVPA